MELEAWDLGMDFRGLEYGILHIDPVRLYGVDSGVQGDASKGGFQAAVPARI